MRPLVDARNVAALAAAAAWRAVHRGVAVVAVTGSSGKTTSRECLAAILRRRGPTLATTGNRNASCRLSKTLLQLRSSHRYAVIEIGIDAPGQMRRWAGAVRPDIAVVHTVNLTHREALPTLEITAREKARVLDALRPGGVAVLNGEDPYVRAMSSPRVSRTVFFGDCDGSIARAADVRASLDAGLRFELHTPAGSRAPYV